MRELFQAIPMYDMGTIGIPDRILLKPSRLTATEYDIMKTHTTLALHALEAAEKALRLFMGSGVVKMGRGSE